jgi:hypothetical protein
MLNTMRAQTGEGVSPWPPSISEDSREADEPPSCRERTRVRRSRTADYRDPNDAPSVGEGRV